MIMSTGQYLPSCRQSLRIAKPKPPNPDTGANRMYDLPEKIGTTSNFGSKPTETTREKVLSCATTPRSVIKMVLDGEPDHHLFYRDPSGES